jgi:hypothetical protein
MAKDSKNSQSAESGFNGASEERLYAEIERAFERGRKELRDRFPGAKKSYRTDSTDVTVRLFLSRSGQVFADSATVWDSLPYHHDGKGRMELPATTVGLLSQVARDCGMEDAEIHEYLGYDLKDRYEITKLHGKEKIIIRPFHPLKMNFADCCFSADGLAKVLGVLARGNDFSVGEKIKYGYFLNGGRHRTYIPEGYE